MLEMLNSAIRYVLAGLMIDVPIELCGVTFRKSLCLAMGFVDELTQGGRLLKA